ncbi:hypothetical protein [Acidovorax sp. BLS4]|uniref:hypothetical protein n=1 Tax=Acidovorax sp. BLS4 TaxID=3273430 RepID=UPI0029437D65|nr:hypothetical protein [Paracidovorax avenae]WOI43775.1 hypothetical protein R1Z03_14645 [Paracidovorax avenae]
MKLVILSWLLGILGFGLVVAGVAMVNVPAACVVAGLALLAYAKLLDRAAAAMPPPEREG